MSLLASAGLTWSTLGQLILAAVVAGVGVTAAFSALIYCADRAIELRREESSAAWLLSAAGILAALVCAAIVVLGLVLVVSKTK